MKKPIERDNLLSVNFKTQERIPEKGDSRIAFNRLLLSEAKKLLMRGESGEFLVLSGHKKWLQSMVSHYEKERYFSNRQQEILSRMIMYTYALQSIRTKQGDN